ncbi:type I restriction-modification system subunit M [Castellaniella sp.]|uniref:type I restriction-modification system subunit M n=1 Tax=Castellaniella sp. TaxID=1955812 RepID=UPI003C7820B7
MPDNNTSLVDFIWKNADDLWGSFKHTDFGKIILPFTLLRRLECVLESTRDAVNAAHAQHKDSGIDLDLILCQESGYPFYNTSRYTLGTLGSGKTRQNLADYVARFSGNARRIFEQFDFANTLVRLDRAKVLYKICQNFAVVDLHPNAVSERSMSNIYEHLIRKFGAAVNEAAEDFMTPRDVVHLATTLVLDPDDALFEAEPGLIRTLYDPTCGTGGFLSDALAHVDEYAARNKVPPVLIPFGQELEPETHAVALAAMLLRTLPTEPGRDLSKNIAGPASTLSADAFPNQRFHYCLANPPFGKKWEQDQAAVEAEHRERGFAGRFGPGLPRISDGSMLFLLHLASKLELPENGGGRAAIVLSGSPLFNGGAGSGESEIRRWLLENDLVDAIVALPTEIFFRTGIGTYLWILSSKKAATRKGRVQLINATGLWTSIKNEGNKRREISDDQQREIAQTYAAFEESEISKVMNYHVFGYRRIRVLRPLRMKIRIDAVGFARLDDEKAWGKLSEEARAAWISALRTHKGETYRYDWIDDFIANTASEQPAVGKVSKTLAKALVSAFGVTDPEGDPVRGKAGEVLADPSLTDYENVPLTESISEYFAREVTPHVSDAWLDNSYTDERDGRVGRVGYEINFNRYFYKYMTPRSLDEIDLDLRTVEAEIEELLKEVTW